MTQNEIVLHHLQQGKELTPLESLKEYGIMRLGARAYDLKQMGYDVRMKMVSNGKKHFASYYIPKEQYVQETTGQLVFV